MVTVQHYRRWDISSGDWKVSPFKATAEFIQASGGEPIPGTAEQVEASALDARAGISPSGPETPHVSRRPKRRQ